MKLPSHKATLAKVWRKYLSNIENPVWLPWFAWRPVNVGGQVRWLETVLRCDHVNRFGFRGKLRHYKPLSKELKSE